jgi:orotidine-5'-phosphate decarboxylase
MGRDSLQPFFEHESTGVFVLCRTSNPGGSDLQSLELASGEPLYERVAALADVWNANQNVGLVVGATTTEELECVREIVPTIPFLVPGVGAQGGDAEAAVEHGLASHPAADVDLGLVNSSRGIIFAGEESVRPDDEATYFGAAGDAAKRLKRRLNQYR